MSVAAAVPQKDADLAMPLDELPATTEQVPAFYYSGCVNQIVLVSHSPHKIANLLFTIRNYQQYADDCVGVLAF